MDIIFCGGGTAACVTAGRLAKANPDLKILMIEGGRNNYQDPTVVNPAVFLTHLAPDSKTAIVCYSFAFIHARERMQLSVYNGLSRVPR
jgi:choline dehydrogenase-like flavoprotein